jgi:ABC-type glycerol-3-phosphate transport system substrate-binding protein
MFQSRFSRAVMMLTLLAMSASGCGMLVPTPEPVTISFVHPEDPTGSYERWVQEFQEQNPHITVELVSRGSINASEYAKEDVFIISQFELSEYVGKQAVLDLTGFIEQDEALDIGDFYPAVLDVFRSSGRQWALPFAVDMMMVYYNRDLFDRYSVAYPQLGWDWGDFVDTAMSMTDPGADLYGYALQHLNESSVYEPVILIYQHGGGIVDDLKSPTRATLDDPLNIEAMEFYAALMYDYGVSPTAQESQRMGRPYPWRSVMEQKVAMWSTLYSERGGLRWPTDWGFEWGIVPMPRDQMAGTLAITDGLFISAASEHPDVAWQWARFLSRKMAPFQMPARRSLAESAEYEQVVGRDVAVSARAMIADAIMVYPEVLGNEVALGAMVEAFAQIRTGEVTPDIALSAAQDKAEN